MNRHLPETVPLTDETRAAWERAQRLWGVSLGDPIMSPGAGQHVGAPAWFSFPPSVTVDPQFLEDHAVADELESIYAHEIGHHVVAPSTRIDSLKIRHQMARALGAVSAGVPASGDIGLLSNLWTDLLVNTRLAWLQRAEAEDEARSTTVGIVRLSSKLLPAPESADRLWWVYCRAYELLWHLPAGTMCKVSPPARPKPKAARRKKRASTESVEERFRAQEDVLRAARREAARIAQQLAGVAATNPVADALVVATTVRTFANDSVSGAAVFGVIAAPYIVERQQVTQPGSASGAPVSACSGNSAPATAAELGQILADQRLRGDLPAFPGSEGSRKDAEDGAVKGRGQRLELARTLALYSEVPQASVLEAWYRTEALASVRPYTRVAVAGVIESIPGPDQVWENGDALEHLDIALSLRSGVLIPGVTTRQRSQLTDEPLVREKSLELDLYIDSSGSMQSPNDGSPAVLAGTILALSIIRGGGRVRVTSFSGSGQVAGTPRFTKNSHEVIAGLCSYFGWGTSFPLDLYRARYAGLADASVERQRHVVVISDDGLTSMFGEGNEEYADTAKMVRRKLTTGTLLLIDHAHAVAPFASAAGYDVIYLESMADAPGACAKLAEALRD